MDRKLLAICILFFCTKALMGQGSKLSIQVSTPTNLVVCNQTDTSLIKVYNISTSAITGLGFTVTLPSGMEYIPGSLKAAGISESNISNLSKPIFAGSGINVGGNVKFRISLRCNCDLIPVLNSGTRSQIAVRADYTGNYDSDKSGLFDPKIPSIAISSISNQNFTGAVDDIFIRKITITNNGKGFISQFYLKRKHGNGVAIKSQNGFTQISSVDSNLTIFNKKDFLTVGDKDSLLEQNESITISDTITIKGCNNFNYNYELYWGCNNAFCQNLKSATTITINTNTPRLNVFAKNTASTCLDAKTASIQTLVLANYGNYPAKKLMAYIFIPSYVSKTRIDTASIYYTKKWNGTKTKLSWDSFTNLSSTDCASKLKTMAFRAKFPNLNAGDTFYLYFNTYSCWDNTCFQHGYDQGWMFNYEYVNQCNVKTSAQDIWGRVYNYSTATVNAFYPSDMKNGEKKDFKFLFATFANFPLHDSGRITVDFVLPTVLDHSLSVNDFYFVHSNGTSIWKPVSVVRINDTIRADFGNKFIFNLLNGELIVSLKAKCGTGNKTYNFKMFYYYNTNRVCNKGLRITQVCNTYSVNVHCGNLCNGGMQFKDFKVSRTSFGFPDNNNDGKADGTGSLDFSKIRTERALYGDTITAVYTGIPKNTNTIDSWKYGFAQSVIDYGAYLTVAGVSLKIYNKGNVISSGCANVNAKRTTSGTTGTFSFNFSVDTLKKGGCVPASYKFNNNDSVILVVKYRLNSNLGGASYFSKFVNRFYLASAANPTVAQSYQCDTFGGNMILYGYYFTNYGPENVVANSCNTISMSQYFYLGIGPCCQNYGGNNLFPFEYRNFGKAKTLLINLPSGLNMLSADMQQYRTSGSGITTTETKTNIPFQFNNGSPVVFPLAKHYVDSGGNINLSDDGFHGGVFFRMIPSCKMTKNLAQNITYRYVFERRNTFGTTYDTLTAAADVINFQVPNLSAGVNQTTIKMNTDSFNFKFQINNISPTLNANNSWFYIKASKSSNLVIKEVGPDTLVKPNGSGIYRAGTTKPSQSRNFQVNGIYNGCNNDTLYVFSAFDCVGYPDSLSQFSCKKDTQRIILEPQMAKLQISISDSLNQREICDTNTFVIKLENIDNGILLNAKIKLEIPDGLEIIPGTCQMAYPRKAGYKTVNPPTWSSGIQYNWDIAGLNTEILKGFTGINDTNRNIIFIKFRAKTNCDKFVSGSVITAEAEGVMKCGRVIHSTLAVSRTQNINNVKTPYYTFIRMKADTVKPCERPWKIRTSILFLGPLQTGNKDGILIKSPDYFERDTNLFNNIKNAGKKFQFSRTKVGNHEETYYKIPDGIQPGDSMVFETFYKAIGNAITCDKVYFSAESNMKQELLCVSTKQACNLNIPTGTAKDSARVRKSFLIFDQTSIQTSIVSADTEEVVLNYLITNKGSGIDTAAQVKINYYFDLNNSGQLDNNDILLSSEKLKSKIGAGESFVVYKTMRIKAGQSCRIFASIDSGKCACQRTIISFGIPAIKNAGRDTFVCSGNPVILGVQPNVTDFTYTWNDPILLDNTGVSRPTFSGYTLSGNREKLEFILETNRGICTTKDTVYVEVFAAPSVSILPKKKEICIGEKVSLDASITGGTNPFQYAWNPGAYLNFNNIKNPESNAPITYRYKLKVTDSAGCSGEDTALVMVNPKPKAWFSMIQTCFGQNAVLNDSATVGKGSITGWNWTSTQGSKTGSKQWVYPMSGLKKSAVTLEVTSDKGCKDTVTRVVQAFPKPEINIQTKNNCNGDSTLFDVQVKTDSAKISGYFWDFGDNSNSRDTNPGHVYKKPGKYTVTVYIASDKGCTDTAKVSVEIFPSPKADFIMDNSGFPTFCFENTTNPDADKYSWGYYHQSNIVKTGEQFKWSKSTNVKDSICNRFNELGTYWVCLVAHSDSGCNDTICKNVVIDLIKEIKLANIFTPGLKDGLNDVFLIPLRGQDIFQIRIYNRYGAMVFESKDPANSWNGNVFNGVSECPAGTYYYEMQYRYKKESKTNTVKGSLYLVR